MKVLDEAQNQKVNDQKAKKTYSTHFISIEPLKEAVSDVVLDYGAISTRIACHYFLQAIEGVQHMHERGFCHRDIKLDNMMLDDKGDLKIIDFGTVVKLDDEDGIPIQFTVAKEVGTKIYRAPEMLTSRLGYTGREVDVFALGVSLFAKLARKFPWKSALFTD